MGRTTSPERWREIERMFDAVLDLPMEERAAFLGSACGTDADLRAEIDRLLDAHDRAGGLLDTPLPNVGQLLPALSLSPSESAAVRPGATIGERYVLEREIGRGGM